MVKTVTLSKSSEISSTQIIKEEMNEESVNFPPIRNHGKKAFVKVVHVTTSRWDKINISHDQCLARKFKF